MFNGTKCVSTFILMKLLLKFTCKTRIANPHSYSLKLVEFPRRTTVTKCKKCAMKTRVGELNYFSLVQLFMGTFVSVYTQFKMYKERTLLHFVKQQWSVCGCFLVCGSCKRRLVKDKCLIYFMSWLLLLCVPHW